MIKIRKASKKDFGAIQKLNSLLFKREQKKFDSTLDISWPFSEEGEGYFERILSGKNGRAWLAEDDDKPVGYLIGNIAQKVPKSRTIKKRAVLDNMFVLKNYRNKKIGGRLVKEFIAWAKENGADNLRVTAFASNKEAIKFYQQNGFQDYNRTLEISLK